MVCWEIEASGIVKTLQVITEGSQGRDRWVSGRDDEKRQRKGCMVFKPKPVLLPDLTGRIGSIALGNKKCDVASFRLAQAWVGDKFNVCLSSRLPTVPVPWAVPETRPFWQVGWSIFPDSVSAVVNHSFSYSQVPCPPWSGDVPPNPVSQPPQRLATPQL